MIEQIGNGIFMVSGLIAIVVIFGNVIWKTKKQAEYRGDERWESVQVKSAQYADITDMVLFLLAAVTNVLVQFVDIDWTVSIQDLCSYITIFIGIRCAVEWIALICFDRRM